MNYKMIWRILSVILGVEAVLMLPALFIAVFDGDNPVSGSFLLSIGIIALVSIVLFFISRNAQMHFFAREGFVCVGLSWIAMSLLGCLPFWFSGQIPKFIDALFEMVSGFTTTGASIVPDVESMSRGLLYWRSFSH
ncbi:MAG: TrkH family potassium uptake protein, partial [Lachnospiraceae bacterium]|nr:TrkH family potassium uptake protein [Lachnospiraceae bacterium]